MDRAVTVSTVLSRFDPDLIGWLMENSDGWGWTEVPKAVDSAGMIASTI